MSVYNPTGSGNVHMDKSISGRKKVAAKSTPAKKAAPTKGEPPVPTKKGAPFPPKKGTKKAY